MNPPSPGARPLWLSVLLPFAAGYFLSYLFRVVNAVIAPDLTRELGLSATDLGLASSAYFFTFGMFQIPLGILLDRYSPQRVEAALLVVAATGSLVFGLSDTVAGLTLGRALIGLGVSACLMAGFTACAHAYPAERLPAANAVILSAGGLGAMAATEPVELVLRVTDWRGVFIALAVLSVLAAALLMALAPVRHETSRHASWSDTWRGTVRVFGSRHLWAIAPAATLSQAATMAIQGLWAGPWLRDVAGFSRAGVAAVLLATALALFAGQLGWGVLAVRLARQGVSPMTLLRGGLLAFLAAQAWLTFGAPGSVTGAWMLFAFTGVVGSLAYPLIAQRFPRELTGRANTAVNLLVFVFAFAIQWLMGAVLDRWPGAAGGYDARGYAAAMGAMLIAQVLACAWMELALRRAHPG